MKKTEIIRGHEKVPPGIFEKLERYDLRLFECTSRVDLGLSYKVATADARIFAVAGFGYYEIGKWLDAFDAGVQFERTGFYPGEGDK